MTYNVFGGTLNLAQLHLGYRSVDLIWPYLNWPHFIRTEWQRFAVAVTNRPRERNLLRSDWSQPRRTGSFHSALTATQFIRDEVRWDEMGDM